MMKALCVFSGGLDSMLAAALIRDQGIAVLALFFETPFFGSARAARSARSMGLPFKAVDITERHLEMVKKPAHGYGGHMNPCIDCHALMFRIAGEMLEQEGAAFVASGEVLGQRPMSQNRQSLRTVAAASGIEGLLLRPLSAKLLAPTVPEERGWVDRERLDALEGRSRKPQMALAHRFGITDYPSPGGGCLLTEPAFSRRFRDLLNHRPHPEVREIQLLKLGRHFRLGPRVKLVVGRNKQENEQIETLRGPADILMSAVAVPGPNVLLQGESSAGDRATAAAVSLAYSDALGLPAGQVRVQGAYESILDGVPVRPKEIFRSYML